MSLFAIDLNREPCAVDDCKERPRYSGEFGERLCGPHLRDQRREAAELAATQAPTDVVPTSTPTSFATGGEVPHGLTIRLPAPPSRMPTLNQEIPMPLEPTKIPFTPCQWPGCDRTVLRHRWCARDLQRVRTLGEEPSTQRDAGELARAWEERQAIRADDRSGSSASPSSSPRRSRRQRPRTFEQRLARDKWLDKIAGLVGLTIDPDRTTDDEIVAAVKTYVRTRDELHTQLENARKAVEDGVFLRQALQMLGSPRDRDLEVGLKQLTDADGALVAELIARCLKAKAPTPGAVLTGEELTQRWNAWEEAKNLETHRNTLLDRIAHEYTEVICGFSPGDAFTETLDTRIAMLRRVALGGA